MSDLTVPRGDFGFYIGSALLNSDDTVFNLTDYTVTIKVWEIGRWRYPFVSGACQVTSSTEGKWRYAVGSTDFLVAGTFEIAIRATKTGAQETTNIYTIEVKEAP